EACAGAAAGTGSTTTSAEATRTGSRRVTTDPPVSAMVTKRPSTSGGRDGGAARGGGASGGRVPHGKAGPPDAVEGVQRPSHRGGRGNQRDLADALRTVRPFGLMLLDEDAFHRGHADRRDDPQRLQGVGHGDASLHDELFGQRVPQ